MPQCTFSLSVHNHAIVLINQSCFIAFDLFEHFQRVPHPAPLQLLDVDSSVFLLPQRYRRAAVTAAHPPVCLSATEYR